MYVVYTPLHLQHNPSYEIYDGVLTPYAETPDRIEIIADALRQTQTHQFIEPKEFSDKHVFALHQREYVSFVKTRSTGLAQDNVLYPSYFMSDTYAPIVSGTYTAARAAVNVALTGAEMIQAGTSTAYVLCRPPGHHAEWGSMGGYCYFNNAAIAANYLSQHGRVAILDIDFHHGNGTQNAFYDRGDVLYVSIHGDPKTAYPYRSGFVREKGSGEGLGFTINLPLPLGSNNSVYLATLAKAIKAIGHFKPTYLVVSAGFDTFASDPIGKFELTQSVYKQVAKRIAELKVPTLIVQEGGYDVTALGDITREFTKGFEV